MINVITSSRYTIDRKKIRQLLSFHLAERGLGNEFVLNVIFVGRNKMKTITSKYKHENETLPVLSFPYKGERTEDGKMLGEVIVCYPLAVLLAAERSKKVDDMVVFLVKHGVDNLLR
jgi:rRNA maturation RNase YbeY